MGGATHAEVLGLGNCDLKTIDAGVCKLNLGTVRVVPVDEILK